MTVEATGYTGTDLFYPRLCVANEVTAATLTASTEATGYPAVSARGPQTYSQWSPTAVAAWLLATFSGSKSINYVAMYVVEGGGCAFQPEKWDGAAYVSLGAPLTISGASVALWLFDSVSTARIRMSISGGTSMPTVATMKAGVATVLPVGMSPGFRPAYLNPEDTYSNIFSEGGQILGSHLEKSQISERIDVANIEASWVRTNWPTLRTLIRTEGIVFAWCPDDFPDEVVYGMVSETPTIEYASSLYMNLSLSIQGPRAL